MADKPLNERTVKEVVDSFLEVDEIDSSDRLHMFVQLVNEKPLLEALQKHNLCLQVGISPPDPIYDFAYGVLRLAKPHLFSDDENAG